MVTGRNDLELDRLFEMPLPIGPTALPGCAGALEVVEARDPPPTALPPLPPPLLSFANAPPALNPNAITTVMASESLMVSGVTHETILALFGCDFLS